MTEINWLIGILLTIISYIISQVLLEMLFNLGSLFTGGWISTPLNEVVSCGMASYFILTEITDRIASRIKLYFIASITLLIIIEFANFYIMDYTIFRLLGCTIGIIIIGLKFRKEYKNL